ncbi:MAG: hypothetical protein JSV84_02045 [Gemmatimonadota bacterium]|nr:MAG: hypothetical protein JSV84_02045 [Gemmatimonadota bacterium]
MEVFAVIKLVGSVALAIALGAAFVFGLGLIFVPTVGEVLHKVKQKSYIFATYMFVIVALMAVVLLVGMKSAIGF